jgi:hypothetical protein
MTQLDDIVAQFERAQQRLHGVVAAVPDERWSRRADPARWSVAECVAHLNLTGQGYIPLLETALAQARALGGPAPRRYRQTLLGWLVARVVGPVPRGRRWSRARTIPAFVPAGDLPRAVVLAEFDRLQAAQIALTRAAAGLPLERVRITSPFNARVRYNIYSAFVILPRHQERHINQAEWVWSQP